MNYCRVFKMNYFHKCSKTLMRLLIIKKAEKPPTAAPTKPATNFTDFS